MIDTSPQRFDRVTTHADYPGTAQRAIEIPHGAALAIAGPATFGLFAMLIMLIAVGLIIDMKPPLGFTIAFIAIGLAMIGGAVAMTVRGLAYYRAPIVRMVAVIVRDRTEVSGGGENSSASTNYYMTLQSRDGIRAEYHTHGSLAGRLVGGDIGVAYVKSHTLVDFVRFDV